MKEKMKRLETLDVTITKMSESSGNEQFYVNLVRTDEKSHGCVLNHQCFETKYLDKAECLSRAWFSASMLARFCGLNSMEEVKLMRLTQEETDIIKKSLYLRW